MYQSPKGIIIFLLPHRESFMMKHFFRDFDEDVFRMFQNIGTLHLKNPG